MAPIARDGTDTQERPGTATAAGTHRGPCDRATDGGRVKRQIGHDIRHQLATIALLADLISDAPDTGPGGRRTARLILGEVRWLEQLHRTLEAIDTDTVAADPTGRLEWVRVDEVATEVTAAIRPVATAEVRLAVRPAAAAVGRLALWRALRNLVDNAVRAAGPSGTVDVSVTAANGRVTIDVDDDGPGFGLGPPGHRKLGLTIVQELAAAAGGELEIGRGSLGGCGVRLRLPMAPAPAGAQPGRDSAREHPDL